MGSRAPGASPALQLPLGPQPRAGRVQGRGGRRVLREALASRHYRVLGAGFREEPKSATHFLQPITSAGVRWLGAGECECARARAGKGERARAHKVCACGCASGGLARLGERRVGGPEAERPGAKGRVGSSRGSGGGDAMCPAEPA